MKTNRRIIASGLGMAILGTPRFRISAQTPQATPDPRMWGGFTHRSEGATLITWAADEPPLPGIPRWVPISLLTYAAPDGEAYVFAELRNATGAPSLAPRLNIETLQGDFSFGLHEEAADTPWVDVDSTAFYYGLGFFGGSLLNSDWDGINLSTSVEMYRALADYDMSGLSIEGERLVNNRSTPVGPVYMYVFVRDKAGLFCGGCASLGTGANTPPDGGSVRLGSPADSDYVPGCGFSMAGMEASEELGFGEPFKSEYRLVGYE